jgi:CO dehydrogenase/acetyl-CoA synthase beta subunit
MEDLIRCLKVYIERIKRKAPYKEIVCSEKEGGLISGLSLKVKDQAQPGVILKENTYLELGNPALSNCAFLLTTSNTSLVEDGKITLIGPDVDGAPSKSLPFGQVLIAGGQTLEADDFLSLEPYQYIGDRLEGYMIRSMPGMIWSRISKEAAAKGFSFEVLGRAMMYLFKKNAPKVELMEVLFLTSSREDVEGLKPIQNGVKRIKGEVLPKRLKELTGGLYECSVLDCDNCPDKPVCDSIKDIIVNKKAVRG